MIKARKTTQIGDIMPNILYLNPTTQNNINEYMPSIEALEKLANFFSIFSDSTRIKIITALSMSDMCVNDLSVVLGLNQTTVSHQLKLLRQNSLVNTFRSGKTIYYSLSNANVNDVMLKGVDCLLEAK